MELNIFISFPGVDQYLARPIHRYINEYYKSNKIKGSIYFSPSSNVLGEDWHDRLLIEIERANVVVVFWTKNSSLSTGQLIEVGAAWALKKRILVVTHDIPPSSLPAMVLRETQSIAYGRLTEIDFLERIRHWFPYLLDGNDFDN
jgi:hypothetical protein